MACKRSAVRARLAPLRSDTEIRMQNRCAFPSEGQDPSEAGRLTSDDAEIVSPPRPTALSRRSRGHQLRQGGLPGGPNSLRGAEPSQLPGAAGGVVVVAWGVGRAHIEIPGSAVGLTSHPSAGICSPDPSGVCRRVTNCREHPILHDPRSGLSQISWRPSVAHHPTEDTSSDAIAAELGRT
jgi:hypothetical protein